MTHTTNPEQSEGVSPAASSGVFLNRQSPTETPTMTVMRVQKRDGTLEPVDLNKIVAAIARCSKGLAYVDPMYVAVRVVNGLFDGTTTEKLDVLAIQTAASFILEEPQYSKLAARLLSNVIDKEVEGQGIHSFEQAVARQYTLGLVNDRLLHFVNKHAHKLNALITPQNTELFQYFGIRQIYDRYLLKHPTTGKVLETPQQFFLRIACGTARVLKDVVEMYPLLSGLEFINGSPTLFNAGGSTEQLSSCFLLDSPPDTLEGIYEKYTDVACLSKFSGGIGIGYSRVRCRGSKIKGTNGKSSGIVPWLKTLDCSVQAVNQGGKRPGACAVYLETWHADIEEFLELRENTGDDARRVRWLNLVNWVPDLFMRRVEANQDWSLMDPKVVPELVDLHNEAFDAAYEQAEREGKVVRVVKAQDLYAKMMRALAQTGQGWMTFKDKCNRAGNQTLNPANVIHLSNLCVEILEVTSAEETAVCNIGSINLSRHMKDGVLDFDKLRATVRAAVAQLDRIIDINAYQLASAKRSNLRWRPVGLGLMGLHDVFFQMKVAFDSPEARAISAKVSEEIYFYALERSCELAQQFGPHESFQDTRASKGELQFDSWGVTPFHGVKWDDLRTKIKLHGLRNSLLIAIAPTATIASIAGCFECIEPMVSNMFKRETLSGDFLQINDYLVEELRELGLWTQEIRTAIKAADGSVQGVAAIPREIKLRYRTAWELSMRSLIDMAADRGPFIDQSQSLNLFVENPSIDKLSSMYMHAWKRGLKTTYYLRSRPATGIMKTTINAPMSEEAVACSLANPGACEACQ